MESPAQEVSTLFTAKIHHGGEFTSCPDRRYVRDKATYIDNVDTRHFGITQLTDMVRGLGYASDVVLYFHYKIPYVHLDLGLKELSDDSDFVSLHNEVKKGFNEISIFVEQWTSKILMETLADKTTSLVPVDVNTNECGDASDPDYTMEGDTELLEEVVVEDEFSKDPLNIVGRQEIQMPNFDSHKAFRGGVHNGDCDNEDEECDLDGDEDAPVITKVLRNVRKLRQKEEVEGGKKARFYVGRKFTNKEQIHEEVANYALENRRQVYIKKNDNFRFRIVCLGAIPALMAIEDCDGQNGNSDTQEGEGPDEESDEDENVVVGEGSNGQSVGIEEVGEGPIPLQTDKGKHKKLFGEAFNKKKTLPKKVCKRDSKPTCPFAVQISRPTVSDVWIVKINKDVHLCLQSREIGKYTKSIIAKEIAPLLEHNPSIPPVAIKDQLQKKHQIHVSHHKVIKAKTMASKKLYGDYKAQYARFREYCEELIRANPGTTVKIEVEQEPYHNAETRQFKRVYVCYDGLKKGFKVIGRNILGLDGCFMKGPYPGQILTAVGVDGNNHIYPVAFAIVEAENKESWTWFLDLLGDDIGLTSESNFTFITDRQKGLLQAVEKMFPYAEHRFCIRHIHENMRKEWPGDVLKGLLYQAARSTSVPYFNRAFEEIRKANKELHEWLSKIPKESWSKAHFTGRAKCDTLLNNWCEVFNKEIVMARDKPIITAMEYIREYMTRRMLKTKITIAKSPGPLTPNAAAYLETMKSKAKDYSVLMTGSSKYQVTSPTGTQCVVDVDERSCTCRQWDLTGMTCRHAVAAIWNMQEHGMKVGNPEDWVDKLYWLDTWKKVYEHTINPISSPDNWAESTISIKIVPPKHHVQVGRPKKMRRKTVEEVQERFERGGKMTKAGGMVRCGSCKNYGHNSRGCKGQGGQKAKANEQGTNEQGSGETGNAPAVSTLKRSNCGICRQQGHNKRSCPSNMAKSSQASTQASQNAPVNSEN